MAEIRYHNRDVKNLGVKHKRRGTAGTFFSKRLYWAVLPVMAAAILYMAGQDSGGAYVDESSNDITSTTVEMTSAVVFDLPANSESPVSAHLQHDAGSLFAAADENRQLSGDAILGTDTAPTPLLTQNTADHGKHFDTVKLADPENWRTVKVKSGDTLYLILKRLNLNTADATFIAKSENSRKLVRLIPGKTLYVYSNDGESGSEIIYQDSALTWLHAKKQGNMFVIEKHDLPTTTHVRKASGEIESSLFIAGRDSGLSDTLTMTMAEIFGWDIDFAINVQPGDRFKVIYEDIYVSGKKQGHGDIIAAEFINDGKTYRAIAHRDNDGKLVYYTPDGLSMQKAFLRTPVKFSRISSRFTRSRYHPVLKKKRAHKGVDYAAPRGTPVRATADGRVIHAGRKGGYGNAVIISHGSTYSTLYAHLSAYGRGIARGSKVKQGQVIGKVGATGLASGPHLHYEFRINGKHVNPLTFKQPNSEPIQITQKAEFEKFARYWEEQLDSIDGISIASKEDTSGS